MLHCKNFPDNNSTYNYDIYIYIQMELNYISSMLIFKFYSFKYIQENYIFKYWLITLLNSVIFIIIIFLNSVICIIMNTISVICDSNSVQELVDFFVTLMALIFLYWKTLAVNSFVRYCSSRVPNKSLIGWEFYLFTFGVIHAHHSKNV